MLIVSFNINPGPPANATPDQLLAFGQENFTSIMWGAWLQAVGPALIIAFAFAIVFLAGATSKLAGWLTMFGGVLLMVVSLIEITFYIGALSDTTATAIISLDLIHAVQHLYFIVGAPSLFLPLGAVVLGSKILPRFLGYAALGLGVAFGVLGVAFLYVLTLPLFVLASAGVQVFWWLATAIVLIVRTDRISLANRSS